MAGKPTQRNAVNAPKPDKFTKSEMNAKTLDFTRAKSLEPPVPLPNARSTH